MVSGKVHQMERDMPIMWSRVYGVSSMPDMVLSDNAYGIYLESKNDDIVA